MDDLMHKHLDSEEQEIIDCILAGPLHEGLRDWRKGRRRLQGLVRCHGEGNEIDRLKCKINVYQRYINTLSNELIRHISDSRRQEVESKIIKAHSRIESWQKVISTKQALQSKEIKLNKDKEVKKDLKKQLKKAKKAATKGNLWGFRI